MWSPQRRSADFPAQLEARSAQLQAATGTESVIRKTAPVDRVVPRAGVLLTTVYQVPWSLLLA